MCIMLGLLLAAAATVGAADAAHSEQRQLHTPSELQPTVQTAGPLEHTRSMLASPWDIEYLGLDVDFSADSGDELVVNYSIAKSRVYESDLLAFDCESNITGIDISLVPSRTPSDQTTDVLSLAYDFDKSGIANSNIWNDTSSTLELCQVVRLTIPSASPRPKMVITEDKRQLTIDFDLSVDFSTNNALGEETIDSVTTSTNVTSYVSACSCGGVNDFSCNTDTLVPNTELFVCIKSNSSDMEIDFLDSMSVAQQATTLAVVENNSVSFPSITSKEYVAAENGVVVSTRVPTNLFTFAAGEYISITGSIEMKLASPNDRRRHRRRLHADVDVTKADEKDLVSPFELQVALSQEMAYGDSSTNTANVIASRGLLMLGTIFYFANTMR